MPISTGRVENEAPLIELPEVEVDATRKIGLGHSTLLLPSPAQRTMRK